jgi:hypothetical protein
MTYSESFLKGIDRFKKVVKSEPCEGGAVLDNGDRKTTIRGIRIMNIFHESIEALL